MSFSPVSIGDILMISQSAWRITRAFANGKRSAPAEFAEVEREANGLSEALKLTVETLHSDDSILDHTEHETRSAINDIFESAKRTLGDFESFIKRYQIIRKRETTDGFAVEQSWSAVLVKHYKTIQWTTEGGDINALRNMLHMHTNTINLTIQALQSRSLARLERTVLPMAENIASIHSRVNGDLAEKIDDLHRLIMSLANGTPVLRARDRAIEDTSGIELNERNGSPISERRLTEFEIQTRHIPSQRSASSTPNTRRDSASEQDAISGRLGRGQEGNLSPLTSTKLTQHRSSTSSSGRRRSNTARRDSTTLSNVASDMRSGDVGNFEFVGRERGDSVSPPSIQRSPDRSSANVNRRRPGGSRDHGSEDSASASSRAATLPVFEKSLFRNSAILCDVRGRLVEHTQRLPEETDLRYETEMVEDCQECRIRVLRRRENRAHGGTRLTTSIWAISVDGVVRSQLILSNTAETVPHCSYFDEDKVSVAPDFGGEILLKFHGDSWTDELEREVTTNWVNYVFESGTDASAFQSALFGRVLVASFKTTKTTVIHEGVMGTFAFEEQFANIGMLRIWEDDGVAMAGAQGGILALIHISSNFGNGWARWWMNCSSNPVKVKSDGSKYVKLKGIDVSVPPPRTAARSQTVSSITQHGDVMEVAASTRSTSRRGSMRKVTGIRIEFKDEDEKDNFLELCRRAQHPSRLRPLPQL